MIKEPAHTRLINAIRDNDIEEVRRLIADGADLNARDDDGATPLHIAAWGDHAASARLLIEKGAKNDLKDKYNRTPLHNACWKGHEEIVRLLIKAGADVNAHREGTTMYTPLHMACYNGHTTIACLLLQHGADVNARDRDGSKPLDKFRANRELRELVVRWYRENCPEAYFAAFCESEVQGPGR